MRRATRKAPKKPVSALVYVGLDLSLTGSAVVVLDREGVLLFAETLKNKLRGEERLVYIDACVHGVFLKYPDAVIVIEGYSMGSHAGQAFSIGELGGVVKTSLHRNGLEFYLVPPTRLKKFITGGGRADKSKIMLEVYKRWGFDAPDDNQADAYGLSQIARALRVRPIELLKAQKEVVRDILNPPEKKKK